MTSPSNKHVFIKKGVCWEARGGAGRKTELRVRITTTRRLVRHADRHTGRLDLHHSFNWKHMRSFSALMWCFLACPHKKVNISQVDLHVRPFVSCWVFEFYQASVSQKVCVGGGGGKKKRKNTRQSVLQRVNRFPMHGTECNRWILTPQRIKTKLPRNWLWTKCLINRSVAVRAKWFRHKNL